MKTQQEIEMMNKINELKNPNIIKLIDWTETVQNEIIHVLEYCEQSLNDLMNKKQQQLNSQEIYDIYTQIGLLLFFI